MYPLGKYGMELKQRKTHVQIPVRFPLFFKGKQRIALQFKDSQETPITPEGTRTPNLRIRKAVNYIAGKQQKCLIF